MQENAKCCLILWNLQKDSGNFMVNLLCPPDFQTDKLNQITTIQTQKHIKSNKFCPILKSIFYNVPKEMTKVFIKRNNYNCGSKRTRTTTTTIGRLELWTRWPKVWLTWWELATKSKVLKVQEFKSAAVFDKATNSVIVEK